MFTRVQAGPYTVRGVSVGGVYTSLQVPELGIVLDAGIPIRSFAGADRIFLSHGHADHAAGLGALLGIRRLIGKGAPRVFFPAEIGPQLLEALGVQSRLHGCALEIEPVPLKPDETAPLGRDLWVRAFRTHHSAPSLGYQFLRRVTKLRPELRDLPREELIRRRESGDPELFETTERLELAYATDTLADVLDSAPYVTGSRVLIVECTFLDERRSVAQARERLHLHLDELLARADALRNEAIVLMHFSQIWSPAEVHAALAARVPPGLRERLIAFAPESGQWFG